MIEYIPISNNLAETVAEIANKKFENMKKEETDNGGIVTFADGCTGCESGCSGSCSGSCTGSCSDSCKDSCKDTCKGSCKNGCKEGCKGKCTGSCQSSCENACAPGCQYNCEDGGQTVETYNSTKQYTFGGWSSTVSSKSTINISANDWNSLAGKVKGAASAGWGKSVSVTGASSGGWITAAIYNSMVSGLNSLGNSLGSVDNKTFIEASHFSKLTNALNKATIPKKKCCELKEYCMESCNESKGPLTGS